LEKGNGGTGDMKEGKRKGKDKGIRKKEEFYITLIFSSILPHVKFGLHFKIAEYSVYLRNKTQERREREREREVHICVTE
jgi:hypothetical protein